MRKTDVDAYLLIAQAKHGDAMAKENLLEAYRGLILSIAKKMHFSDFADIREAVQAGSLGLLEALQRFDLQKNVAFSTYAFPWILGEISRSMKKMTEQSAIFERPEDSAVEGFLHSEKKSGNEYAETGRRSVSMSFLIRSLDQPVSSEKNTRLVDLLPGGEEINLDRIALQTACAQLADDEKKVVFLRYFRDLTQSETALIMQKSQTQISRIENRSVEKLRNLLTAR